MSAGLVVDLFAGGGGASVGVERALGRPVDIAINHDRRAIAMHIANHPEARHYHCDIWEVDPIEATGGRPVDFLWASPDCTFYSKARGGKPFRDRCRANRRRALATVVIRWARDTRPGVIMLENVEEFAKWGPLDPTSGRPIKARQTATGRNHALVTAFVKQYNGGGEQPRASRSCAAPLSTVTSGGRRQALVSATLTQFYSGGGQHATLDEPLRTVTAGGNHHALVAPVLHMVNHGGRSNRADEPVTTLTGSRERYVMAAYLARHWGGMTGKDIREPWPTLTTKGCQDQIVTLQCAEPFARAGEVRAFLTKYYSNGSTSSALSALDEPLHTLRTKACMGIVTVEGQDYQITDIGMRMLTPREMFAAQGFPPWYRIEDVPLSQGVGADQVDPPTLGITDQTFLCGNSVCPPVAEALVRANVDVEHREFWDLLGAAN